MYDECTMHYIKASALDTLIDSAIRRVAGYVLEDEAGFIQRFNELSESNKITSDKWNRKEITSSKKRIVELDGFIKKLYEGNATGKIPDRQFEKLMAEYDEEQQTLESRVAELEEKLKESELESMNSTRFISLVKKYRDFSEITPTMLNELVEKVVVHEATGGRTKNRRQQIDIYFNFIGQFEVPYSEAEVAAMEEEARHQEELKEQKRKESRKAASRKYQEKKREQAKAEKEAAKKSKEKVA
jgi:hypothetical protein